MSVITRTTIPATVPATVPAVKRTTCATCADALVDGTCLNIGACATADRSATPRDRGAASMARPSAFTISGRVD